MALALTLATAPATARPEALSCRSCLVVADDGDVLFERAAGTPRPNASTTKMLTALEVVARAELRERVIVSDYAAATGGGGLDLEAGERYSVRALLHALLLTSSNDAAVALAEHVATSERGFVAALNRRAARLGAGDTRLVTPHGLDRPGHYSTALDLARIARSVLETPVLARIVAKAGARISGPEGAVELENRNVLLESYRGAIGIKTGYTAAAGEVLVAAARRRGRTLIAVAMASENAASDARVLLNRGFRALARGLLVRQGASVASLVFDPSGAVPVVAGTDIRGIERPEAVATTYVTRGSVRAPVEAGDVVGTVELRTRWGRSVGRAEAIAARSIEARSPGWIGDALAGLLATGHRLLATFGLRTA